MPWIPLHQTWKIYWQIYPLSIEHRWLEYSYTKLGRSTAHQLSRDALNTATPNLVDLLEQRCLEYHYTKLGRSTGRSTSHQLSGDALITTTPNLEDLLTDLPSINRAKMTWILLHQTWQIYCPSIEHRCLEYHYTKLGRSTPSQLSINALNTTTPNLEDLPTDLPSINRA